MGQYQIDWSSIPDLPQSEQVAAIQAAHACFPTDAELRSLGYSLGSYWEEHPEALNQRRGRPVTGAAERWQLFADIVHRLRTVHGWSEDVAKRSLSAFVVRRFPADSGKNAHLYGKLSRGYMSAKDRTERKVLAELWKAEPAESRAFRSFVKKLDARRVRKASLHSR